MGRRRGARPCRLRPGGLWMERGTYLLSCRLTHLVSWPFAAVGSGGPFRWGQVLLGVLVVGGSNQVVCLYMASRGWLRAAHTSEPYLRLFIIGQRQADYRPAPKPRPGAAQQAEKSNNRTSGRPAPTGGTFLGRGFGVC